MDILDKILSLGTHILMPLLMFILAVFMRAKLLEAFKGALYIGVALLGISMISSYFLDNAAPVVQGINVLFGNEKDIADVGWPVIAMLAWSVKSTFLIVPIHIIINLIMLKFKLTSTVNVDIWNYWHMAVASFIVYSVTANIILAIAADIVISIINLKLCDWANPAVKEVYDIEDTQCISTANGLVYMPFAVMGNALIDKIPYVRKISVVPKNLKGNIKYLFNPGIVAFIIGLIFALVAGQGFIDSISFGMKLGAVFLILPLVISLLKEGFTPVSNATATFAMKHITKGRKVYVGVNQLITDDNPSLRITAILLIPITVILSISIPAIRIFPMGDLMNIISIITVIVAVSRGDIFRSVIISIPVVLLSLFSSTVCAEYYTAAAANIGYDMGAVTGSFAAALNGNSYICIWLAELLQGNIWAILFTAVMAAFMWLCYRYYKKTSLNKISVYEDSRR